MINLSIQNIIPFLGPHLVPWGLRTDKENGGWKPSGTLWSPLDTKAPFYPYFLFAEKGFRFLRFP